jgi:predicted HTH transcriptional regulator
LEFKATACWENKAKGADPEREKVIVKAVAGFLNNKGGTLLIGVSDRKVVGIQPDLRTMGKQNSDGFELWSRQRLVNSLGQANTSLLRVSFPQVDGHMICRIDGEAALKEVWVKKKGSHEVFYAHIGNSTQPLTVRDLTEYVRQRWK